MCIRDRPWDIGEGGYQVGNFPPLWSEWNGKYRDCLRDFWRGEDQTLAEFASRIAGSSDLYQDDGRHPSASINFVTAHDGFTLADLTAYNDKHNDANGELVAAEQHRHALGEQQRGEEVALRLGPFGLDRRVVGRPLGAVVPGAVVALAVPPVLAVGLVVLLVVGPVSYTHLTLPTN